MTSIYAVALLAVFVIISLLYLRKVSESKSPKNRAEKIYSEIEKIKSVNELESKLENIHMDSEIALMTLESSLKIDDNSIKKYLIERALSKKSDLILDFINKNYNSYDGEIKYIILMYLSSYGSNLSIKMFTDFLVVDHMNFERLPLDYLMEKPRYSEIIFPRLMRLGLEEKKRYQLYRLINIYLDNKLLFSDKLDIIKDDILIQYKNMAYDYERYNDRGRLYWRYDVPMYMETRSKMLILIEMLGYVYEDEVFEQLRRAVKFNDPLINAYSLISLIRLGEKVDDYVITLEELCEYPEVRNYLYFEFEKLKLELKFPSKFRSQQYLAQSEIYNQFKMDKKIYAEPLSIKFISKIEISDKYSLYAFVCEIKYSKEDDLKKLLAYSGPFLNDKIEVKGHGLTRIIYEEIDEDMINNEYIHSRLRDSINNWLLKL